MKKIICLLSLLATFPINAKTIKPPKNVASLIADYYLLDDKCRGGSGDNPETMKSCDKRDAIVDKIQTKGWCWGKEDETKFEKCSDTVVGTDATTTCSKLVTFAEKAICSDSHLNALDAVLNRTYKGVLNEHPEDKEDIKRMQRRWLHDIRAQCQTNDCLKGVYKERIRFFNSAD